MNHDAKRIKNSPSILIASASVGAGHKTVAQTLKDSLNRRAPDIRVRTCDVLSYATAWFRAYYRGGFAYTMSKMPYFYGLLYHLSNHPHNSRRNLFEQRRLWTERQMLRRFTRRLMRRPPSLIINTHFISTPIIEHMNRRRMINIPQMVLVTDFEVHRFWYSKGVSRWFVPSDYSAHTLWRWGIRRRRITVSGIPVRQQWTRRTDRSKILNRWNLDENKPLVILTGGTQFTCGPIYKIARGIVKTNQNANLVVITGANKKLYWRLSRLAKSACRTGRSYPRLRPIVFTRRLGELVSACTLMVTKAGGVTLAECIAGGVPMVILKPVPGHEEGNAAYLASNGAAVVAHNWQDTVKTVGQLLNSPRERRILSQNAAKLYRPATQIITDAVLEHLGQRRTPT